MERLIKDAAALDESVKANDLSFGNVVKAIHAVQTELGITGTTAKEAATTITGSVNAAKAAWTNLVSGMADENADLETLFANFESSATTAADNVTKRVEQAIEGMLSVTQKASPKIGGALGNGISKVIGKLPTVTAIGEELIDGIFTGVEENEDAIAEGVVSFGEAFVSFMDNLTTRFTASGSKMISAVLKGVAGKAGQMTSQVDGMVSDMLTAAESHLPSLLDSGSKILTSFLDGFDSVDYGQRTARLVGNIASKLIEMSPDLVDAGLDLGEGMLKGLTSVVAESGDDVMDSITELLDKLNARAPELVTTATNFLSTLIDKVSSPDNLTNVIDSSLTLVTTLIDRLEANEPEVIDAMCGLVENLIQSLFSEEAVKRLAPSVGELIVYILKKGSIFGLIAENLWEKRVVSANGSHKTGLSYVPYDGYIAELHQGERVLTAQEARTYEEGAKRRNGVRDVSVVVNVTEAGADGETIANAVSEALYAIMEQEEAVYA